MKKAYGYARVSHIEQVKKDNSIPAQRERIKGYYDYNLKHIVDWGGIEDDNKATSASKISFENRPAGQRLLTILEDGDHIIFDKVDRIWRSVKDFVNLIDTFKNMGVTVHFCDFRGASLSLGTPMGDFFLTMMVAIAELESKTTGSRIKDAIASSVLRRGGHPNSARWFCDTITAADKSRVHYEWNEKHYELGMYLKNNYDAGYKWSEIVRTAERDFTDVPWNRESEDENKQLFAIRIGMMMSYILQEGIVDPNKSPSKGSIARKCKSDPFRLELTAKWPAKKNPTR